MTDEEDNVVRQLSCVFMVLVIRFGSQLSMNYRVEAEKFRGAVISRVYFKGRSETDHFVDGVITARRSNNDTPESCVTQTVYVKVSVSYTAAHVHRVQEKKRPKCSL